MILVKVPLVNGQFDISFISIFIFFDFIRGRGCPVSVTRTVLRLGEAESVSEGTENL